MTKVRIATKRIMSIVLMMVMTISCLNITPTVARAEETNTVADWKFGQSGVKSGSIAAGNLVIADQSGNNNDLNMELYTGKQPTVDVGAADWTKYLSFDNNTMNNSSDGSMVFKGSNSEGIGADFITDELATINSNRFEQGYTIEFLYYFPQDWTVADQWMGLMARQVDSTSNVASMSEPQLGSMSVAVSNCKEIQFQTAPSADNEKMSSAAWSVSMDRGGVWYHIAITSDGDMIRTYVNGCEAFRDYASSGMDGLFADPADGRFRIGSSWWMEGTQTLDKFLKGNLQEVRISNTALDKSKWLVSNPEQYVGEFGTNDTYQLKDADNYNFVFLPDTQNTVKFKPAIMDKAVDELISSADQLNIAGVVHLGDIVENNNDGAQYNSARSIFYQLPESGIKFLAQQGNHDGWSAGISNYYNSFSKNSTLFMRRTASYLTNNSPSGNSSYMLVNAGSYRYLVISLSCSGSASGSNSNTSWDSNDEAWFKNVLASYPNCPTIVTTHDLQSCSDTMPNSIMLSTQGQKLWNIVKNYDQVFMMVGGHNHGSGVQTLTNTNGKPVISVLADYQFSYNGGNGFFKYAEFDEKTNKIYFKTYSPYAASLDASEKTFFDVNFMTGDGNYNEVDLNFATRFVGMEKQQSTVTGGKWMSGEYHSHTNQSNDATVASSSVQNMLDVAYHDGNYTSVDGASNITQGSGFDYFFLADHFRKSIADADGNSYASTAYTPRYIGIAQQVKKFEQLQAQGKYQNKIFYSGFEWDMPGLDHASVGIIDRNSSSEPINAIHEFEWLYADQNNDPDSLYENNGSTELATYGARKATTAGGRSNVNVTYEGIQWLKDNYPESYVLPNHPSRHNGSSSGVVTVANLRKMNDLAPYIVFGFEGMPGNQLSPDGVRSELNDIYGGADVMLAKVGGIWDSMLSEGRHFYNFTNSDSHFKISGTNSSGYYPGEYSRNYTYVNAGSDGSYDYKDVITGMRSGNSFAVYGDLINALDFTAKSNNTTAVMGSDLNTTTDNMVTLNIRFKSPSKNNYAEIAAHTTTVTNNVSVDHVDLISGEIGGKLNEADYATETSSATQVIKTFSKADWGTPDAEGYYTISYEVPADKSKYYRLRGTNLAAGTVGYTDAAGNPLQDTAYNTTNYTDFNTRVNLINDRNYTSLWFYSNPIFVYAQEPAPATAEPTVIPTVAPSTSTPVVVPTETPTPATAAPSSTPGVPSTEAPATTAPSAKPTVAPTTATPVVTSKPSTTATPGVTPKPTTTATPSGTQTPAPVQNTSTVAVTKVTFGKSKVVMDIGKSYTQKVTVAPANASNALVTYKTSNSKVATVSGTGKVVAKAAGIAKITATAMDGSGTSASYVVNVKPKKVTLKALKSTVKKSVTVTWSKVSGATGYKVYVSTKSAKSGFTRVLTVKGTSVKISKLNSGKKVYVKVVAYKKSGATTIYGNTSIVKSINAK